MSTTMPPGGVWSPTGLTTAFGNAGYTPQSMPNIAHVSQPNSNITMTGTVVDPHQLSTWVNTAAMNINTLSTNIQMLNNAMQRLENDNINLRKRLEWIAQFEPEVISRQARYEKVTAIMDESNRISAAEMGPATAYKP